MSRQTEALKTINNWSVWKCSGTILWFHQGLVSCPGGVTEKVCVNEKA
jgi:hypothetical protein